jgi:hypothetical protein
VPRASIAVALLTAGALISLSIGIRRLPGVFDEGYALYGAERVLDGEVPYRDFWLVYAPAQLYVLAAIFKLFGVSMMAARIYDVLVRLAIVVLMYQVAANLTTRLPAIVCALVGALWLGSIAFYSYAMYPALAFALLSVWFLLRHVEEPKTKWSFCCGLCVAATTLFRHDLGLYGAISTGVVLAASSWFESVPKKPALTRAMWRALWPFACGLGAPVAIVLVGLCLAVPVRDLWFDLIVFPATVLNRYRALPYPAFPAAGMTKMELRLSVLFYFPVALFACSIVFLLIRRRSWGTMALTLLGILYFRQGLNRVGNIHLLPTTLIATILTTVLLVEIWRAWRRSASVLVIAAVLALTGDSYIIAPARELWAFALDPVTAQRWYSLPRGQGIERIGDEEAAILYVRDHTAPGEKIFVPNSRQDQLFVNDILFYFLAERPCGTRYHDLTPGVATSQPVQEAIVSDLQRNDVQTIVVCSKWESVREPNESGKSSGVTVLDSYLTTHYKPVARFGNYVVARSGL